jgi:hypothetical protein
MTVKVSRVSLTIGLAAFFAEWLLLTSPGGSQTLILEDTNTGLEEWRRIESVLTHPRCLNCHSVTEYPRQGDDRRQHGLGVRRGPNGYGSRAEMPNLPSEWESGGLWHPWRKELAYGATRPRLGERAGQARPWGAICATLKQPGEDGEPDYERLIEYVQLAPFVLWAWEPGTQPDGMMRTPPPLPHDAFVEAIKRWISAGAPCPPLAEWDDRSSASDRKVYALFG